MEQLNLPITDLYGNKLPESDYLMDMVRTDDIYSIEFFPDYMSSSIWIRRKSEVEKGIQYHTCVDFDELELEFPQWFKNQINAMQKIFDCFADSGSHEVTYGFTFDDNDNFLNKCIKMIEADFRRIHPKYKNLLQPWNDKHNSAF